MKKVALSEVKDDLSRYLGVAEKEEIVIARHGKPAGILIMCACVPHSGIWKKPLFAYFTTYKNADKWITANMNYNTKAEAVLPECAMSE